MVVIDPNVIFAALDNFLVGSGEVLMVYRQDGCSPD